MFTPRTALAEIAPASRVAIYGYYHTSLGYGRVGGSMVTFETIGRVRRTANLFDVPGGPSEDRI